MSVLITGAFGFVGSNLSAYLVERGIECWALDVKTSEIVDCKYKRQFIWDNLSEIPWRDIDVVVHLAGKAHDVTNTSEADDYFRINFGLTERIFCKFAENNVSAEKKFLFFSSVKACSDTVDGVLREDAVPNPKTPYGSSKLKAEQFLETRKNDARIYVLRPAMIHGPGNKGNLNLLYKIVSNRIPWPLGIFKNERSFTSIENICAAVYEICMKDIDAGTYNVADDETFSTNELISLMTKTLGFRERIWCVPAGLIRFIAKVGDVLHLPLNSERLKKLTESYVVSNEKIKIALGWSKMPISAVDGLKKSVESFK